MTNNLDQTEQIRLANREQSPQEFIRQLSQQAGQALTAMRIQQEQLRARGMALPMGSLERMQNLEMSLQAISAQMVGIQIELRQLRSLADTSALINSALDVDEVLNQVMDTAIILTGAERGFIMLKNEQGELEFRIAREVDPDFVVSSEFKVSNTIINHVVQSGQAVLTDNAGSDPRYQEQKSIMRGAFRSILAVPLRVGTAVTGVVYCDNRIMTGLFKEHELNLLRAFADQAAVALENARLFAAARAQVNEIARIRDLMANIFDSLGSGILTLDQEDRITSLNAAAERLTGRPTADLIGQRLWDLLPDTSESFYARLQRVKLEQTRERWEARLQVPGVGLREWQVTMTPLRDAESGIQGVALVLEDLTESRQRTERVKAVRSYLPLALVENIRSADITAMGGQEREISVIFADVRGFTRFSETLEPEELMQIINRYLGAASSAIDLYEGVIDKYLGDAVTGLFNTPLNPQSDHANRAVRAAIRLIKELLQLHERLPEEHRLYFGIGIHTGPAVLGNVGSSDRREFTALGEAMEMSKLLQENARRGEILVSAATYEQVNSEFDFEALAPHKTGGRADFTVMYRLLGRKRRTSMLAMPTD